jgi:RNA polymerase sigma-70 factor (ECF subfamily)
MSASTIEEGRWRELRARLSRFVGRRVGNPQDAEDVVQDIFVRMQRNIDALSSAERLDAWAFRIARNAIADYYRAPDRREAPGEVVAKMMYELSTDSIGGEPSTDARAEMAHCIAPMVGQLPNAYRQAIELTELEGLTQAAAAERLGLSVPGMKSRVQRGRARLRGILLRCCEIETDRRGRVVAFETREGCAACGNERRARSGSPSAAFTNERVPMSRAMVPPGDRKIGRGANE